MAMMSGAWKEMTTSPTTHQYESPRAKDGIWRDKVTRSHRESRVTDRELKKKRDFAPSDCFGNLIVEDRHALARMTIERAMNLLPVHQSRQITARAKWEAVELLAAGRGREATQRLRDSVV